MPKSTITSKNPTVRKEVRATPASDAFLRLRGSIKVGPGDPVEGVHRARNLRGTVKP